MATLSRERTILSILSRLNVDRSHHKCVANKSLEIRRQMDNKLIGGSSGDKRVPIATRDVIASHLALEDQGIHVNIEDVIRMSTCKCRENYEEVKRNARTAIGSSVNLKHKNSVHSLAVVSDMEGLVRGAEVLIAGLEKQGLLEEQPKGYYNTSRYHAGALWLEALRTGNDKGIKKSTLQMQAGGLSSRKLDDIAAHIAAANDLLKDRLIEIPLAQSISSVVPVPLRSLKKRRWPTWSDHHHSDNIESGGGKWRKTLSFESPRQSLLDSNSNIGGRVTSPTMSTVIPRFSSMGNTRVGGVQITQRRASLMNGSVLDSGKMIRHSSPKSRPVHDEYDSPIPSSDGIGLNIQQAMVLESKKTMDHNDMILPPSAACNMKNDKTSTKKFMVSDTKNALRILSLQDREKLVRLHMDELLQTTS